MKHEISAIRAGGSELPATANLMYDYNGLDYKKFKDVMDIASWDNYPSWHKKTIIPQRWTEPCSMILCEASRKHRFF